MRILPLLAACLALAACGTRGGSAQLSDAAPQTRTASSSTPSLTPAAATSPDAASPSPVAFDLSGTAWRATMLLGQPVAAERPPELEFDWLGRPNAHGFTGCEEFGFAVIVDAGALTVGDLIRGSACEGSTTDLERTFLAAFQATEVWSVEGDRLSLDGLGGQIVLARELPPVGDPGRQVADILRAGESRILSAPGVANLELVNPVRFGDRLVIAAGTCGFASDVRFGEGGALDIVEVGWDTGVCGPVDGRPALKVLLDAVSSARLSPAGTVILSGSPGEVVLGPAAD